jgi:hypothetical protein
MAFLILTLSPLYNEKKYKNLKTRNENVVVFGINYHCDNEDSWEIKI